MGCLKLPIDLALRQMLPDTPLGRGMVIKEPADLTWGSSEGALVRNSENHAEWGRIGNSTASSQVWQSSWASKRLCPVHFERSLCSRASQLPKSPRWVCRARSCSPQLSKVAAARTHQLTRWSTSKSGAGCAARSQSGSLCTPSSTCASHPSHKGGPRAGLMCGGLDSTPMWFRICRISALCVMNAIRRI